MTTMTDFSSTAERIGKTASEKRAVEAMANALGSVENAIADGDTHYEGHCFIDDVEQELAVDGVETFSRLVKNEQLWLAHHRDAELDFLLLSTAQFFNLHVRFIGKLNTLEECHRFVTCIVTVHAFQLAKIHHGIQHLSATAQRA